MAYQNVGTPRFYVCTLQWLKSMGELYTYSSQFKQGNTMDLIGINPSSQKTLILAEGNTDIGWNDTIGYFTDLAPYNKLMSNDKNFQMALGHNFGASNAEVYAQLSEAPYNGVAQEGLIISKYDGDSVVSGFSISVGNDNNDMVSSDNIGRLAFRIDNQSSTSSNYIPYPIDVKIGSLLYGNYYDMPHSPDLNLKMSIEMDGIKSIQTKGGSTLSNASYTKPADWGEYGAWQLGNYPNHRNGRRVWDLSFSYLSDSDIFPLNAGTSYFATIGSETGYPDGSIVQTAGGATAETLDDTYDFTSNILNGEDFFSQVWNRTMGGHLPFIFQPNKNNSNPDQFAIARFDMDSLEYEQVANNVYNVKLKIRESW